MSVDYNECENCRICKPDTICEEEILNNEEVVLCKTCIKNMINEGLIIQVDDGLTQEQQDFIDSYGRVFISTKEHLEELICEGEEYIKDERQRINKYKELLKDRC
jgi:hypothetical protein